ncbi:sensor histidine kinase [Candidatus Poribacteria bacterium]|nr:sensor histidine kinase [Candidatus Poribacteria bacterium]
MFGKFFEEFAKEIQNKHGGIRAIGPIQRQNIMDFIELVKNDVISIERDRWSGAEKIWDKFIVNIECCLDDLDLYYDDYSVLHFTIYELLKNAYLKLFYYYETANTQNIDISIRNLDDGGLRQMIIAFSNACPYTEKQRSTFAHLKRGIRLSRTGGSGVGLFCCQQFLRNYYGSLGIYGGMNLAKP